MDGGGIPGAGWAGTAGAAALTTRAYARGTLAMVRTPATRLPLLVNGRRSAVPVIHANGTFTFHGETIVIEFVILDDAEHPLLLQAVSRGSLFQMVRIDFPDRGRAAAVESDLASKCRAEIPGIYFEFGTAELRGESAPALADVGRVLRTHADWKVSVQGHTDSVGSVAANLALSQRRADAVRTALATRFHVAPSRLTATGFGQSSPREPNTSLEGRARNRRVEIVRQCSARP